MKSNTKWCGGKICQVDFKNLSSYVFKMPVVVRGLLLGLLLFSAFTASAAIRYVRAGGSGNGSSWVNASGDLQAMINASAPGDQVWVATGTYKPTTGTDRTIFFSMKNGVELFGGFPTSGNPTLADRNWAVNTTVLSGDIGTTGENSDNSYHVVFNNNNNVTSTAVLDGFAITGGNADAASGESASGGGLYNSSAYPTIRNCLFNGNTANSGGGIFNTSGSAVALVNCGFYGNVSMGNGGGIFNGGSNSSLVNCTFYGNTAFSGGGIFNLFSLNVTAANCIFWGNGNEIWNQTSGFTVTYSIVQGGYAGTGNLSLDPMFVDAPAGNFSLLPCSPAIDAGNNAANATTADLGGNARIFNATGTFTIDMGAYEYQSSYNACTTCYPNVLYVNDDAVGANTGKSWGDAFTNLQSALNLARQCSNITEIWVAAGLYKPTTDVDRTASFEMRNNLAIYGGFKGTETQVSQRNWAANTTILSGDIGMVGDNTDNTYHVVDNTSNFVDNTAILDGFTVTGGNANGSSPHTDGGGMHNVFASPTVANCIFSGNAAINEGGGIANAVSSLSLTNCTITGNTAGFSGGGIENSSASPIITNCVITGNTAASLGGGMDNNGGGPILNNCLFANNMAINEGGGIHNLVSALIMTNCTFSDNSANEGGGISTFGSTIVTATNCIFWGNSSQIDHGGGIGVAYSIVQGGFTGTGNSYFDPLFVDAAGGDYRLQTCSPAIDAGDNTANSGMTDLDGNARNVNATGSPTIDMGAYEHQSPYDPSTCQAVTNILYVNDDATGANNGFTWENAFNNLQSALALANLYPHVTEIWVAAGTYKPTTGTDRGVSFVMKNGVALYGGFAGTEMQLAQRNWAVNVTTLSGDIGAVGNNADNSYHVILNYDNGLDNTAVLDGFTISGGNANGSASQRFGGGMYNRRSSPAVRNCTFSGNLGAFGGGMNNDDASPVVSQSIFSGNIATVDGGGIANFSGTPRLSNCTFSSNSATGQGGGVTNIGAAPVVGNCTFFSNSAFAGGGMFGNNNASPTATNCVFSDNSATYGGGLYNEGGAAKITNCKIYKNTASLLGGGMYHSSSASPVVTNCTFNSNTAIQGGAMYSNFSAAPTLTNCILWGNSSEIRDNNGSNTVVTYSIVQWNYSGVGNMDEDPRFVNAVGGDLHVQPCSPAVDAGNNAANTATTDLDGNPRINNLGGLLKIDLGAYEANYDHCATCLTSGNVVYVNANANGANNGKSWADAFNSLQSALVLANQCSNVTEIWVARGTYKPTDGTDRAVSFVLKNGLALYGGFNGTETSVWQKSPWSNATILSGDIGGAGDADNSYHVVANNNNGLDGSAVLDGFNIVGGNANGSASNGNGGGIYNLGASPTIRNCTITNNSATNGGGVYNQNCSPLVTHCLLANNTAANGGLVYNNGASPTVTQSDISGNSATNGGVIYNTVLSAPIVSHNRIRGNSATLGGVAFNDNAPLTMHNCTLYGNSAGNLGGGLYNTNFSIPIVTNCTFYGNVAGNGGGSMYNLNSSPVVTNCILWGNSSEIANSNNSNPVVTYSIVQGNHAGVGNLDTDPLFADATFNNFFLLPCSPAVDAGNNAANTSATDLGNSPRVFDATGSPNIDMGAYEFQAAYTYCGYCLTSGNVIYVKHDATGNNDGKSWGDAFTNLQSALNIASQCPHVTEIWVAAGTYTPTTGTDRAAAFAMVNGVTVYGGFAGTETQLSQRDWTTNVTILSGDIGVPSDNSDNSYHVVSNNNNGLDASAGLDGFTISGGNANEAAPNAYGGGMYNFNVSPTVKNCLFAGNAANSGAGMYNTNNALPKASGCTFSSNTATYGGGMYNFNGASPTVDGCTFTGNTATYGGGMYSFNNASPILDGCTFSNNTAIQGGGMFNDAAALSATNCVFSDNEGTGQGGCILNQGASLTLTNCLLTGNSANSGGAIYHHASSYLTATNCTFYGNTAIVGGGLFNSSSASTVVNCIFWGNSQEIGGGISTVRHSIVEGGYGNCDNCPGGNGHADPLFFGATNLRLQNASPAIDAGDDAANTAALDLDGNPRKRDLLPNTAHIDLGAYELPEFCALVAKCLPTISVQLDASNTATLTAAQLDNGSTGCGSLALSIGGQPSVGFTCLHTGTPQTVILTATDNYGSTTCQATVNVVYVPQPTVYASTNVPLNIATSGRPVVTSSIHISGVSGNILDLNVKNLQITHSYIGDLKATLTSPGGVSFVLFDRPGKPETNYGCDENDVFANFDDGAANTATQFEQTCNPPPFFYAIEGTYQPVGLLAALNGISPNGTWTLKVEDFESGDGGSIDGWALEVVTPSTPTTWYADADNDGYGSPTNSIQLFCAPPSGYVANNLDCNDNNSDINPLATEVCDGVDNNCAGGIDEGNVCCPANGVLYVDDSATGLNNGFSWLHAFTDLQSALASVCPGVSQIWVAAGTYKPTETTDRSIAFALKNGVAVYGGFNGTEAALSQRNWAINLSILSGDIGVMGDHSDNSYHVIANDNNRLDHSAALDGFTITGGNANGSGSNQEGGGMYNVVSSPALSNCIFNGNTAGNRGGGMYNDAAAPMAINCTFTHNAAPNGGGLYNQSAAAPILINSTFSGNSANLGGGLYNLSATPEITNCIIWGNSSGMYNDNSNPIVRYSIVQSGYAPCYNCPNTDGDVDPLFIGATDLRLQNVSPALDAGDDAANTTALDLDANPRTFDAIPGVRLIDLGAYERQSLGCILAANCQPTLAVYLDGAGSVAVAAANLDNGSTGRDPLAFSIGGQPSATFSCAHVGSPQTLSLTVADIACSATCQTVVTVADNLPPTALCRSFTKDLDLNGSASITTAEVDNQSTDNCGTVTFGAVVPNSFNCSMLGAHTVTLTVNDDHGNTATCQTTVTIRDNTVPNAVCRAALSLNLNADGMAGLAPAQVDNGSSDNCELGTLSVLPNSFTCQNVGTQQVVLTALDVNGNSSTCTTNVTVSDNLPPTITCPANIARNNDIGQCSGVVNYPMPTGYDNCGTPSTALLSAPGTASGSNFPAGTTVVRWMATDGAGLSATCSFTVTVTDTQPPSITCPANIVRANDVNQCGAVVMYAQPVVADNCGGAGLDHLSGGLSGSMFQIGATTVRWMATDAGNHTVTCAFTVTVADVQAPNIVCPANQAVGTDSGQCYATVSFAAPTGSDNCTLPSNAVTQTAGPSSGAAFSKGTTTVAFKVADAAGLTKTCSFRVIVSDVQNPTIVCPGPVSVPAAAGQCSAVVTYSTPTATDNCTPAPTVVRIAGTPSGSTVAVGSSTVIWRAIDGAGRSSTCSIGIAVTDNQAPSIICPGNIAQANPANACNAPVFYPTPTATDNCGVNALFLVEGMASGSSFPVGSTSVVWRAVDNNGLNATCSFSVTVSCGAYRPFGDVVHRSPDLHRPAPNGVRRYLLSPNPAVEMAHITWDGAAPEHVAVFDAQGRLVWEQGTKMEGQSLKLDVLGWAAGVYMVALWVEGTVVTKRLVVEKD